MRVLLVDPQYVGEHDRTVEALSGVLPSIGMLSVAAVLRRDGHDVSVLDCQFHSMGSALAEVAHCQADLVAISLSGPWSAKELALAGEAKQSGAIVVVGGPFATVNPQECLSSGDVDLLTLGESEETMRELCHLISNGFDRSRVRGIQYLACDTLQRTPERRQIADLDALPMPALDLVPVERYFSPSVSRTCKESIVLVTSHGCPWRCSFCSQTVFGHSLRTRSPRLVVEEMRYLRERHGKRDFMFFDDVFTVPRKRVESFCRMLMEEEMDVAWGCVTRADLLDRPLLDLMKRAGCYEVGFGVESGSQAMLDRIGKELSLKTIWRAARDIRNAGLRAKAFFIIGLPGESREQVMQTLRLAESLPVDFPLITFYQPIRGTPGYAEAQRSGTILNNYGSDPLARQRSLNFVPDSLDEAFLSEMYRQAYRRIYWHPRRVLRYILRHARSLDDLEKGISSVRQFLRASARR